MAQNLDNVDLEFRELAKIDGGDSGSSEESRFYAPDANFLPSHRQLGKIVSSRP